MANLLRAVDALLRGAATGREQLAAGRLELNEGQLTRAGLLLGACYGVCMGLFAAMRGGSGGFLQLLSSALKVPPLFLLTLLVTFPSLYVFSALARSRLGFRDTLRLLLAAVTINLALLASFGPITGFFTLSTDSYPFMKLLNVAFFAISGLAGLAFLKQALALVFAAPGTEPNASGAPLAVFRIWTLIYAVVGAQMGWILRPFLGDPGLPFQLFREREKNFFVAFLETLRAFFQ